MTDDPYRMMWERLKKYTDAVLLFFEQYPSYDEEKQNQIIKKIIDELGIEDGIRLLHSLYQTSRGYHVKQVGEAFRDKVDQLENEFLGGKHKLQKP